MRALAVGLLASSAVAVGTIIFPVTGHGATFAVNSATDANDALAGDGGCATVAGVCALRAAIEEANALAGTDSITLPAGTFRLALGRAEISDDLTIGGTSVDSTIIKGGRSGGGFSISSFVSVQVANVTISNSNSQIYLLYGGALDNRGTLILTNVAITNSFAGGGGGLYNEGAATLTNVTFTKNRSFSGGGILNWGTLTFTNGNLAKNRSGDDGGGGGLANVGTAILANVTFEKNFACEGGGLRNGGGTVTLSNVTLVKNRAFCEGGGLFNVGGTVTLSNVTLMKNRARRRGGGGSTALLNASYEPGLVTLRNSIVEGSRNCDVITPNVTSLGHNLDSGTTCGFSATGDLSNTDPLLGPLQDNGGETETVALLPGSPAIDAGDNTGCPATDQRGVARPQGAACDIGAYEFQP